MISLLRVPAALLALTCGLGTLATAQVVVLDNFNATGATGKVITSPASTWIGNVTRNQGSITVGGNARDDNGWGASNVTVNATGMKFITISGQRDSGNLAPSLVIQLIDSGLQTQIFSVPTTSFSAAGLSLVEIPIGTWTSGFNPAQITDWTIGGGTTGIAAFRMTLENLSLSATALPARHSADTDQNFRINLTELTRVMELYQTRNNGVRTGCYDVATSTTEDGFVPAPGRAAGAVALSKYHSADSDRDGALSLAELTRMIELYNYRDGTLRTGQYRVQATGSVDGFATGP